MERRNYYDGTAYIQDVCGEYGFKDEMEKARAVEKEMDDFSLKIMFTGGFSAGKSAAVNMLLERDLLIEKQTPETAIASELVFDNREYIEAVSGDSRVSYNISDAGHISPDSCDYLVWHINNPQLRALKGYTVVDMPGFNSGLRNHNNAILRYAGNGNAYVVVVDCEEGEIKDSLSEFMNEIRNYDNNVAVVVSKTDKKLPEQIGEITDNVKFSAENIFGFDVNVAAISKKDSGSKDKLFDLISSFDKESIFAQTFGYRISELCDRCIIGLNGIKRGLSLNEDEINAEISAHEKNKAELERRLADEEKKLSKKMTSVVKPQIIDDAREILYNNAEGLANAALSGGNALSAKVNDLLRNTLVSSARQHIEVTFNEFAEGFSVNDIMPMSEIDTDETIAKVNRANKIISSIADNPNAAGVYKAVTGTLAVVTSVVAPWLELVIIFLPEIVGMFSSIFAASEEKKRKEQAHSKIINEVIPTIIGKLEASDSIDESLDEMKNQMLDEVRETINARIQAEMEGLSSAKQKADENRSKYEEKISAIDEAISRLKNIIKSF